MDDECEGNTEPDEPVKEALHRIETALRKTGEGCSLCSNSFSLESKEDVFRLYSAALSCVFHHAPVESPSYEDLYVVESFVLREIAEQEVTNFEKIFTSPERNTGKRDALLRASAEYFSDDSININCEQEIESLMYKLYKLDAQRSSLAPKEVELLLLILYKRSEAVRFLKVFSSHRKTVAAFKLALLVALRDEPHSKEKLLREMKGYRFEASSYFSLGEELPLAGEFADLRHDVDVRTWLEEKERELEWHDCVHVWALNRADASGAVNKSMLDLCMQYGKYEEGWAVYLNGCEKSKYVLHKACVLVLKALKASEDERWIGRLLSILEESSSSEDGCCCLVADDIMENLADIPEETRMKILAEFAARVKHISTNGELLMLVIKGLARIVKQCLSTRTCELCATYANLFYTRWKACKTLGIISEDRGHEAEIYSSMLGVCDTLRDCDGFNNICRDLVDSKASITKDLCEKIESFSISGHGKCGFELAPTEKTGSRKRLVFRSIKE
jgi:hypothetical protein